MNTQEHIKNCKGCGNGFYCKGFEICHVCSAKRAPPFERVPPIAPDEEYEKHMNAAMNQGMYGGKDNREAQRALNMMYSDLANEAINKDAQSHYWAEQIAAQQRRDGYAEALKETLCLRAIKAFVWFVSGMTVASILGWLF